MVFSDFSLWNAVILIGIGKSTERVLFFCIKNERGIYEIKFSIDWYKKKTILYLEFYEYFNLTKKKGEKMVKIESDGWWLEFAK